MSRANHAIYSKIIDAIKSGDLKEPFASKDFCGACPGFAQGTYKTFLGKHRVGNPGHNSELFKRVGVGRFKLMRPLKYEIK